MNKSTNKTLFRSIKGSMGRFMAIFAIVALGVGFLAGLMAATPDMRASGSAYFEENNLADFRLLSAVGFDEGDIAAIAAIPGIKEMQPTRSRDVLFDTKYGTLGMTVIGKPGGAFLGAGINMLTLEEGRVPQNPGECLVQRQTFTSNPIQVGDMLTLSAENDDLSEVLDVSELTVVGVVTCPFYMSMQRENTTVGNGTISEVIFIYESAFLTDYYTEIYLTMENAEGLLSLSDEYLLVSDPLKDDLTTLADTQKDVRYDFLMGDAQKEIDDAWATYYEKKAEADSEFAKADEKIRQGKIDLAEGSQTLADKKAEGLQELADAKLELEDGLKELEEGEAEYLDGVAELEEGRADYEQGLIDFNDGLEEYEDGLAKYEDGLKEYEEGKQKLVDARKKLDEGEDALSDGKNQFLAGKRQLEASQRQLDEGAAQLGAAMGANISTAAELIALLNAQPGALDAMIAGLEGQRETLTQTVEGLEQTVSGLQSQIEALEGDIAGIEAAIGQGATDLEDELLSAQEALVQLQAALGQAEGGLTQARQGLAQVEGGLAQLPESEAALVAQLQYGQAEIDNGWKALEKAQTKLDGGREEIDEGWQEYLDGAAELEDARIELEDAKKELDDALIEIEDGRKELEDALIKLEDGEKELADGRIELDDGWAEYYDGLAEYEDGLVTFDTEIAKANADIEQAYRDIARGEQDLLEAKADAEIKLRDAEEQIRDGEKQLADVPKPKWYILSREEMITSAGFQSNTEKVESIVQVFPVFFFLISALVSLTTMTRMVDEERGEIGLMKALGYSNGAIVLKYLLYALVASLAGSAIGLAIGFKVFPSVVWKGYSIMYLLPPLQTPFIMKYALMASLSTTACTLAATAWACSESLKESPSSLMLPKAPKAGKKVLLEYWPWLWRQLTFSYKVTARNLFRYKKRFFMTVFGVAGCTALLLTGFGLKDSISGILTNQFDRLWKYDLVIGVKDTDEHPLESDIRALIDSAGESMLMRRESCTVYLDGCSSDASIHVPGNPREFTTFVIMGHRLDEETVSFDDASVILTEKMAMTLGAVVGDTVTVENADNETAEVTVTGIVENYVNGFVYMPPAVYAGAYGHDAVYNTVIVKSGLKTEADRDALATALLECDNAISVSFTEATRKSFSDTFKSIDFIVLVLIICAAMLAFIVLYNLTNINISERQKELATLKVLGFYDGEVSIYVLRETLILSFLGGLAGLVLGKLLHAFVARTAEVDMVMFGRIISLRSYLVSLAITMFFSLCVSLVMNKKLKAISMVESLKAPE